MNTESCGPDLPLNYLYMVVCLAKVLAKWWSVSLVKNLIHICLHYSCQISNYLQCISEGKMVRLPRNENQIHWNIGLKYGHEFWHWWPWPWIFKEKNCMLAMKRKKKYIKSTLGIKFGHQFLFWLLGKYKEIYQYNAGPQMLPSVLSLARTLTLNLI